MSLEIKEKFNGCKLILHTAMWIILFTSFVYLLHCSDKQIMDDISYSLEAKPEPSRTMAYKTRKTVYRLERKQLHLNHLHHVHVVPERPQEE